ncbi:MULTISPECIES: hypothetical protein [unclassified Acinetobacter]|uniref:hypothetical protein n=1 Tax=unclassified Acinetobacter TaxID=196816 RepID=UPI0029341573|nr:MULTISPECIES: hypothetical protein [unclassified Acinetobacter]WOE32730.1 hypothetical protein QSG84_06005 [Acinetobacter sp. SAAs470]WOE38206.1 hypothetical protein QSG86_15060 [Acinetobacter sp. SAAs474]
MLDIELRIQFENDMQDWIMAFGRPTWDEDQELYEEKEWQFAWIAYCRAKTLI